MNVTKAGVLTFHTQVVEHTGPLSVISSDHELTVRVRALGVSRRYGRLCCGGGGHLGRLQLVGTTGVLLCARELLL